MKRKLSVIVALASGVLMGCDRIEYAFHKLTRSDAPVSVESATLVVKKTEKAEFEVRTLRSDFYLPWSIEPLSDNTILITEKPGSLYQFDLATGSRKEISGLPDTKKWGQGGLMDVVAHPDFEKNRLLYFSYAGLMEGKLAATRVARARLADDKLENVEIIFTAAPAVKSGAHFGSALVFDQKGYLYITSGERGQRPLVQDLSTHLGKVIRLNDDGSVPSDNPFVKTEGALPEIYSYGHRNPQGIGMEPGTGKIWAVEHGPRGGDEVNVIQPGANYGWPVVGYGKEYRSGEPVGEATERDDVESPIHYYVPSIATSGMTFYDSSVFPEWKGNLFIGALSFTHINRLEIKDGKIVHEERLLKEMNKRIRDVDQGADGFLYVLTDDGHLLQLRPVMSKSSA